MKLPSATGAVGIITRCGHEHQLALAIKLYQNLAPEHVNGTVCAAMMDVYRMCNKPEGAISVFQRMEKSNIALTDSCIKMMIEVCCKLEDTELANKLVYHMKNRDLKLLNNYHFTSLIKLFHKRELYKEIGSIFDIMKEKKVKPDQITFTLLLKAAAAAKDVSYGSTIIAHIKNSGIEVDRYLQNSMLTMYSKT